MKETGGSSFFGFLVTQRGAEIDVLAMQAAHPNNALRAEQLFVHSIPVA